MVSYSFQPHELYAYDVIISVMLKFYVHLIHIILRKFTLILWTRSRIKGLVRTKHFSWIHPLLVVLLFLVVLFNSKNIFYWTRKISSHFVSNPLAMLWITICVIVPSFLLLLYITTTLPLDSWYFDIIHDFYFWLSTISHQFIKFY